MRYRISAWTLALSLVLMPGGASARGEGTGDLATDMVIDVVVLRPLGLVATVLGTALTVVALPFTIPSGSVDASAQTLIVAPARYTFARPLGELDRGATSN